MPGDHKQKKKVKDLREKLGKAKKTNKLSKKIRKESMIQDVDEYYKEKKGKIRKADTSDINRVTRWDERTFNKNREMPKSKVREEEDIEQVRTDMDLHPYQAIAKLRKRLAKVDDYKAESDPEACLLYTSDAADE